MGAIRDLQRSFGMSGEDTRSFGDPILGTPISRQVVHRVLPEQFGTPLSAAIAGDCLIGKRLGARRLSPLPIKYLIGAFVGGLLVQPHAFFSGTGS